LKIILTFRKLFSDGEVFGFKCSAGLLFDVNRQICDFKLNVDNCDVVAGELLSKEHIPISTLISVVSVERQFIVATNLKTAILFPET